jgi:hypothetical protein
LLHIFRSTCEAHVCEECLVRGQRSEVRGQGVGPVGAGRQSSRRP